MNTLSWLIYFAGAAGNVRLVLFIGCLGLAVAAVGYMLGAVAANDEGETEKIAPRMKQARKLFLCILAPAFFIAAIPSQGTVYAIAASEMGESALKSETGGKAVQALNAWLDRQIAGEPKDNK